MQNTQTVQPEAVFEAKSSDMRDARVQIKTAFNDGEYQRWSEKLLNIRSSKDK